MRGGIGVWTDDEGDGEREEVEAEEEEEENDGGQRTVASDVTEDEREWELACR